MIAGIGTDIVAVERIAGALRRHGERLAQRVLTAGELADYRDSGSPAALLARRFAAKEAAAKALGTGIGADVGLHDLEVEHDDRGRPLLRLHGGAARRAGQLGVVDAQLSLSDERDYAVAFVVLVQGGAP